MQFYKSEPSREDTECLLEFDQGENLCQDLVDRNLLEHLS